MIAIKEIKVGEKVGLILFEDIVSAVVDKIREDGKIEVCTLNTETVSARCLPSGRMMRPTTQKVVRGVRFTVGPERLEK